ncbi:MAG TPA: ATP synthase F1 subunit delta [Planctomycetes bacterium]|nr:ATP synthase F1 subunit delta [Planctomycetota bacterium]
MAQDPEARDARFAAQQDAERGAEGVAEVYAEAILDAAEKAGRTEAILEEFDSFIADVLDRFPRLEQVLASRLISHEDRSRTLDRVLASQASSLFLNCLRIISRHERFDLVRMIHRQLHALYDRLRGRVRVELVTATPVPEEVALRVTENLKALVDGQPVVEHVVDPRLIGGAVLRVGDTVYDGSIANRLNQLRKQIIDRSAHEIQSRRDRFRDPTGD